MSRQNVEVVRGAFAAFQRGDMTQIMDLLTDDLVTHRVEPDNASFHGKEGFFQATADWTEHFEDWTVTPEEFIDAGMEFWFEFTRRLAERPAAFPWRVTSGSSSPCAERRSPA